MDVQLRLPQTHLVSRVSVGMNAGGEGRARGQEQPRPREVPKSPSLLGDSYLPEASTASFAFSMALLGLNGDPGDEAVEDDAAAGSPSIEDLLRAASS